MALERQTSENTYEFFLVVAPGFEALAEKEISRLVDVPVARERGGLTVHLGLAEGLELNRVLRIPTRILLRLAAFGCRDFPKLFKKTAGFPWAEWVSGPVDFVASTHKSRLFIKKRIEQTCRDGFAKAAGAVKAADAEGAGASGGERVASAAAIYVRFLDDVCTFSLDTSGELLHKRGVKTMTSEAPLRETIAAAMLAFMGEPSTSTVLVDPMVGSGTFFFEAAGVASEREYAFEQIPKYRALAAPETPAPGNVAAATSRFGFARFIGFEIDEKTAGAARENLKSIGVPVTIEDADIFDAKPLAGDEARWLIANPPYGERLKIEGRLKDYYELLFETCERVVQPQKACFVLPDSAKPEKLRAPSKWRFANKLKFQNGGLPVTALLFERS
jgi:putative N6-adenine-specific DNA methylase